MKHKVCIDPGHGQHNAGPGRGYDPGAVYGSVEEAALALMYGKELQGLLLARDIPVFMTRTDKTDPAPVWMRASRAAKAGCTHLVSLHFNASTNRQAHGVEVLYRRPTDKALAEKLAQAVGYALSLHVRGAVSRDNLAVLKFALGPAILIEFGFLSHDGDRNVIVNEGRRKAACEAVVKTLLSD